MAISTLDLCIILLYIAVTIGIGFWISKKATASTQDYFLGGNSIPWYYLGISNASGMFDISGTMWMVYLLFVYGLKSVWIPWLWPAFNQIFLMIYLSVWLRRSGVMTGAEWINFRFGHGRGAAMSHFVVVAFAILNVIGFLAYGFVGIGKFTAAFVPHRFSDNPEVNANTYGLIITAITTLYVVKGGMFSVVFTELLQFVIMTIASIAVGIIAMNAVSPDLLAKHVPADWGNLFFGWKLNLDWGQLLPAANAKIAADGWTLFGPFFMMMLFKGWLQSAAGPVPNYDMQRVLSAKNPVEAAKMSGIVNVVLFIPRYMLVTGLTILAIVFFSKDLNDMGENLDFELILPFALKNFIPAGLVGLLIAGLMAAFMSTYAATVNAAPAYLVNDIYRKYIKPDAPEKHYVRLSVIVSVVMVIIGTLVGFFVQSINDMVQWIVAALYGGYTASNVLKWYWWRINAWGFFYGMASGMLASGLAPWVLPGLLPLYTFPFIFVISLLGCLLGSYLTEPDDETVLKNFYKKVRPWGFWKPIRDKINAETPGGVSANTDFWRDMINVIVGIIWQVALTATGVFLVIKAWDELIASIIIILVSSFILKRNWLDQLQNEPPA
jgi:solute:Na+ symporter, SSS family